MQLRVVSIKPSLRCRSSSQVRARQCRVCTGSRKPEQNPLTRFCIGQGTLPQPRPSKVITGSGGAAPLSLARLRTEPGTHVRESTTWPGRCQRSRCVCSSTVTRSAVLGCVCLCVCAHTLVSPAVVLRCVVRVGRSHDSLPRFHPRSQVANELRDALTNVAVLGNHVLVQDQVRMPHLIMPRRARLLVAVLHDHFLPQPPTTDDGFCKMAGRWPSPPSAPLFGCVLLPYVCG